MTNDNMQNTNLEKKRLFFLMAGKTCPLDFNAVMVYSFLVYRFKAAKGVQQAGAINRQQIHRGTGLSATGTIPKALKTLEQHGLIGFHDKRIFPWQPKQADWFVNYKNPGLKPWHSSIAYFPVWIPVSGRKSGLVPRTNALFFLMRRTPNQRQVYYALKLKVSTATVRSAIKTLRQLRLVEGKHFSPVELNAQQLTYWQDRKPRTEKVWRLSETDIFKAILEVIDGQFYYYQDDADGEQDARQRCIRNIDFFGNLMRNEGYSTKEIDDYWRETTVVCGCGDDGLDGFQKFELWLWGNFITTFKYAREETIRASSAGRFSGNNSAGLLKILTRKALNEINVAWENCRKFGGMQCFHKWNPIQRELSV